MPRITYRDLAASYWKSDFGKSFRKAGFPWNYFEGSLEGFFRTRFEIPHQTAMTPRQQALYQGLEIRMREEYARRAAKTRRQRRLKQSQLELLQR